MVYAFNKPDRQEHCVVFWDTKNGEVCIWINMKEWYMCSKKMAISFQIMNVYFDVISSGKDWLHVTCGIFGKSLTLQYDFVPVTSYIQ